MLKWWFHCRKFHQISCTTILEVLPIRGPFLIYKEGRFIGWNQELWTVIPREQYWALIRKLMIHAQLDFRVAMDYYMSPIPILCEWKCLLWL